MLTWLLLGSVRTFVNTLALMLLLITHAAQSSLLFNAIYETRDRGIRESDILTNVQLGFHCGLYKFYTSKIHKTPPTPR